MICTHAHVHQTAPFLPHEFHLGSSIWGRGQSREFPVPSLTCHRWLALTCRSIHYGLATIQKYSRSIQEHTGKLDSESTLLLKPWHGRQVQRRVSLHAAHNKLPPSSLHLSNSLTSRCVTSSWCVKMFMNQFAREVLPLLSTFQISLGIAARESLQNTSGSCVNHSHLGCNPNPAWCPEV